MRFPINFTFFAFHLNALLDRGELLDYRETRIRIDNGSLFKWLQENYEQDIDLSIYTEQDLTPMLQLFQSLNNVMDARRKMGVERNGLSLLLGYCLEGIQQGSR